MQKRHELNKFNAGLPIAHYEKGQSWIKKVAAVLAQNTKIEAGKKIS